MSDRDNNFLDGIYINPEKEAEDFMEWVSGIIALLIGFGALYAIAIIYGLIFRPDLVMSTF